MTARSRFKNYLEHRHPSLNRVAKLFLRAYQTRVDGYPRWDQIVGQSTNQWRNALDTAGSGPNILLATSVGCYFSGATIESMLGVALTLRGARVDVLLCDSALPACFACDVTWYPKTELFAKKGPQNDLCKNCFVPANEMFKTLGFKVHRYSEFLRPEDEQICDGISSSIPFGEISSYIFQGVAVGEHAWAGTLRFFARATLDFEPYGEQVLRRYFKAALLTASATTRLLEKNSYESMVFHHGIYVPQGLLGEVARKQGVRVVNWNPGYRKKCFIFSHGNTYHHTMMNESTKNWEHIQWTPTIEQRLLAYLKSRWDGSEDWIWFHEHPAYDMSTISREVGVDFRKPSIGLLTSVMWDAQLHYPANAFPTMREWLVQTIEYFRRRPELQLLVRVHPAEVRGTLPSRQPVIDEIHRAHPKLPPNVFIIPPESNASTYAAMQACNAVLIYSTKTGTEIASMGIPVVVAGEAWVRNKGFTWDATSTESYFKILDGFPLKGGMRKEMIERARKYAFHFFFRRMIPLEFCEPKKGNPPYRLLLNSINQLMPGHSKGLDVICDGILNGVDFIYPDEEMQPGYRQLDTDDSLSS